MDIKQCNNQIPTHKTILITTPILTLITKTILQITTIISLMKIIILCNKENKKNKTNSH